MENLKEKIEDVIDVFRKFQNEISLTELYSLSAKTQDNMTWVVRRINELENTYKNMKYRKEI